MNQIQATAAMLLGMAEQAEEFKPAAQQIVKAIKLYGEDLAEVMDTAINYIIDRKAASVKRLVDEHGFTREEAIMLVMDIDVAILKNLRSANNKSN